MAYLFFNNIFPLNIKFTNITYPIVSILNYVLKLISNSEWFILNWLIILMFDNVNYWKPITCNS